MKRLHPRIEKFYNLLKENFETKELPNVKALNILKAAGATATEAAITFHLGFNIEESEADTKVRASGIFPYEDVNDIAYQTFTYLYY
jgi:hypothetical protein